TEQTLIQAIGNPYPDKPQWSIPQMGNVYGVTELAWTADQRYVTFVEGGYEGSNYGIFDTDTRNYTNGLSGGFDVYRPLITSPVNTIYVIPQSVDISGLYVGDISSDSQVKDISSVFKKEKARFGDAAFSPDGEKIVFTYQEGNDFRF